jgi:hypothetical protein
MDDGKHTTLSTVYNARQIRGSILEDFAGRCYIDVACWSDNPIHLEGLP